MEDSIKGLGEIKEILSRQQKPLDIEELNADRNILKIYGNGFNVGFSLSDATIVIQLGSTPVAILNLSHIALKSLAGNLLQSIEAIEKTIGEPIKSIQDYKSGLIKK